MSHTAGQTYVNVGRPLGQKSGRETTALRTWVANIAVRQYQSALHARLWPINTAFRQSTRERARLVCVEAPSVGLSAAVAHLN
jgi:hypothetical protein